MTGKHVSALATLSILLFAALAGAQDAGLSVASMPPSVVQTIPRSGETAVDPNLTEIRATFSKDMKDGNWSWVQITKESFPKIDGDIRFLDDHRTCVVKVKLEPGTTYVLWVNSDKYKNFKDPQSRSAVPYLLVFETAKAE